ncbi:MAG: M20 family metallo-hydrolase [Zestosphaera sp.]
MVHEVITKVSARLEASESEMVEALVGLVGVPAVGPDNGGLGEFSKGLRLLELVRGWSFDRVVRYDVPDPRAEGGVRPNILAYYYGTDPEASRLWILTHLDVVPPGDLSQWTITHPFKPAVVKDRVYGRGTEDNGQSIVASLYAVKALMDLDIRPKRTVILAFVSDEETGSKYGLRWLLDRHPDLFMRNDMALVPDAGKSDGSFIEVAEKSILRFKVVVRGRQTHGSMPHLGLNAHRVLNEYVREADDLLHNLYAYKNELYDPPTSTFEPTVLECKATAPNIIPGECLASIDCRILPEYSVDDVLEFVKGLATRISEKHRRVIDGDVLPKIAIEVINKEESPPPTPLDSEVVTLLRRAVKTLRGIEVRVGGIGGGTVARFLRKAGIHAVVWSTVDETAHQPNEYAVIRNIVEDAKVMAMMMLT